MKKMLFTILTLLLCIFIAAPALALDIDDEAEITDHLIREVIEYDGKIGLDFYWHMPNGNYGGYIAHISGDVKNGLADFTIEGWVPGSFIVDSRLTSFKRHDEVLRDTGVELNVSVNETAELILNFGIYRIRIPIQLAHPGEYTENKHYDLSIRLDDEKTHYGYGGGEWKNGVIMPYFVIYEPNFMNCRFEMNMTDKLGTIHLATYDFYIMDVLKYGDDLIYYPHPRNTGDINISVGTAYEEKLLKGEGHAKLDWTDDTIEIPIRLEKDQVYEFSIMPEGDPALILPQMELWLEHDLKLSQMNGYGTDPDAGIVGRMYYKPTQTRTFKLVVRAQPGATYKDMGGFVLGMKKIDMPDNNILVTMTSEAQKVKPGAKDIVLANVTFYGNHNSDVLAEQFSVNWLSGVMENLRLKENNGTVWNISGFFSGFVIKKDGIQTFQLLGDVIDDAKPGSEFKLWFETFYGTTTVPDEVIHAILPGATSSITVEYPKLHVTLSLYTPPSQTIPYWTGAEFIRFFLENTATTGIYVQGIKLNGAGAYKPEVIDTIVIVDMSGNTVSTIGSGIQSVTLETSIYLPPQSKVELMAGGFTTGDGDTLAFVIENVHAEDSDGDTVEIIGLPIQGNIMTLGY